VIENKGSESEDKGESEKTEKAVCIPRQALRKEEVVGGDGGVVKTLRRKNVGAKELVGSRSLEKGLGGGKERVEPREDQLIAQEKS